jgi:hypothetical protein
MNSSSIALIQLPRAIVGLLLIHQDYLTVACVRQREVSALALKIWTLFRQILESRSRDCRG